MNDQDKAMLMKKLEKLDNAIESGVYQFEDEDTKIVYRSLQDLMTVRAMIKTKLSTDTEIKRIKPFVNARIVR